MVCRHKSARKITLSFTSDGIPKVTVPRWATLNSGISFAVSKSDWIKNNQPIKQKLNNDSFIGYNHRLNLLGADGKKLKAKADYNFIHINSDVIDESNEYEIIKVIKKALNNHAKETLPERLDLFANTYSFNFENSVVKDIKTRWGSCSSKNNINLSMYLVQLPIKLIDYVLVHELCHTREMNHSKEFWAQVETIIPDYKTSKRELRNIKPNLIIR